MEIIKEITIVLTPEDLKGLITKYLKSKGVDTKSIHFGIIGCSRENDYFDEFPLEYNLHEVVCKVSEVNGLTLKTQLKQKILEIAENLRLELITEDDAKDLLLNLFGDSSGFSGYCSKETLEGQRCKNICNKPQCGW